MIRELSRSMGGGQVKIEGGITYFGDVRLATPFFEGSQGGGGSMKTLRDILPQICAPNL